MGKFMDAGSSIQDPTPASTSPYRHCGKILHVEKKHASTIRFGLIVRGFSPNIVQESTKDNT